MAPVKDPFSCPKSSESIVPSGIAPQFTAMYYLRKKFFSRTAFSGHEHRKVYRRDAYGARNGADQCRGVADNREPLFCGCDFRRYVLRLKHFYIIKQLSKRIRGAKEHRSVRGDICRVSLHQETPPVFPPISARRSRRARLSLSSGISPWEAAHCADASRSDRGC